MTMKAETGDRWSICREHQQGYTGWFFALHCESNSQESRIKGQAGLRQQTQGSYLNLSVSSESEKCRKSHCTQRWSIEVIEINFERCSDGCAPNRPSYSSSQPKSHEAALFSAGLVRQQIASCFLVSTIDGSCQGLLETVKQCAQVSHMGGGIGIALSVLNPTMQIADQCGKRKGSLAAFLADHHMDLPAFLFMERVKNDAQWTLFDPLQAPGLANVFGREFEDLYHRYEREGRGGRVIAWARLTRFSDESLKATFFVT